MDKNLEVLAVTTVANELNMGNNQASLRITIIFLMVIMGNSCYRMGSSNSSVSMGITQKEHAPVSPSFLPGSKVVMP